MLSNTIKNQKIRKAFFDYEQVKRVNKFLSVNLLNSIYKSKKMSSLILSLVDKTKDISKSKIKNKCVFTGRNKSVEKKYSFSRITLLNMCRLGLIPGYKKAVW